MQSIGAGGTMESAGDLKGPVGRLTRLMGLWSWKMECEQGWLCSIERFRPYLYDISGFRARSYPEVDLYFSVMGVII